jgi:sterol desaturase/sphingolipid hydroxylase (fatty acid hydroxylase superfamily)
MRMSKLTYFAEFFLFPPLISILLIATLRGHVQLWLASYFLGLGAWTLFEYLLHRVVFHHFPVLSELHERHHHRPLELIGTPAWVSASAVILGFATPLYFLIGTDCAAAMTSGLMTGYLAYVFVHYATHHFEAPPDSYLYRARLRHAAHHYRGGDVNFGVTTAFWDHVFGTAWAKNAGRTRRSRDSD